MSLLYLPKEDIETLSNWHLVGSLVLSYFLTVFYLGILIRATNSIFEISAHEGLSGPLFYFVLYWIGSFPVILGIALICKENRLFSFAASIMVGLGLAFVFAIVFAVGKLAYRDFSVFEVMGFSGLGIVAGIVASSFFYSTCRSIAPAAFESDWINLAPKRRVFLFLPYPSIIPLVIALSFLAELGWHLPT